MPFIKLLAFLFLNFIFSVYSYGQGEWMFTELAAMPEEVANNAVIGAHIDSNYFVYSFGGIDNSKIWSGIHKRCYKYDLNNNSWTSLPELPNGNGRIAAGASYLKNKIYIIGGYEVFSNQNERSFSSVHVLDIKADTFLADASDLLYPIDDHIQAVWRDSLIYVVTGWSNTTNIIRVQVYNPITDVWSEGTPVPNTNDFKVFGGSGEIIGDTIFYAGGASLLGAFNATRFFRKGVINPADPLDIAWSGWMTDEARGYRMAASTMNGNPIWFGGSQVTYNFNGIAYNGSGTVSPTGTIRLFDVASNSFVTWNAAFTPQMDFRGVAKIDDENFLLAGGMRANRQVTDALVKLTFDPSSSTLDIPENPLFTIYPMPVQELFTLQTDMLFSRILLYNCTGELLDELSVDQSVYNWNFGPGLFLLKIIMPDGRVTTKKIISIR